MLRKALEKMPLAANGKARLLRGRPLAEWALPDALLKVLTTEEMRYLADRLIYSFWHRPVHAEAALLWAAQEIFRGKSRMAELPEGMAALPKKLASAIEDLGGQVELSHRLSAVELPASEADSIVLRFETGAGGPSVTADRLVLALPAAAVGRVEGLGGRSEIEALRSALMPQEAVATALVYEEPWWRRIGIGSGASTTDLPARHLRHHGAEPWRLLAQRR
jgi:phytoene dehydrogenase-like protein